MTTSTSRQPLRLRANRTLLRRALRQPAAREVAHLFALGRAPGREVLYKDFELTIRPGQVTAVVGPSGAGKSVLLDLACRRLPGAMTLPLERFSRSDLPPVALLEGPLAARLDLLSRCGLAEAAVMITPARRLSGGQRYRLALAWVLQAAMRRGRTTVVVADEFASCLDRVTAEALCRQLRKLVSGSRLALLVATPREELLGCLCPDQIVVKPLGGPPRLIVRKPEDFTPLPVGEGRVRAPGQPALASALTRPFGPPSPGGRGVSGSVPVFPAPVFTVERGTIRDYRELAGFHYVAGPPAAHKRVYVIRPPEGARGLSSPEVAAVLVVSPPLACVRGRNLATDGRYLPSGGGRAVVVCGCRGRGVCGHDLPVGVVAHTATTAPGRLATQRQCLARLNAEMECISRVIVHPVYRGLGLAVRLVRHALADSPVPLMEALSVMGRIHPLFQKGGMTSIGRMRGRRAVYSYYIAHTGLRRPVVEWLWNKENGRGR